MVFSNVKEFMAFFSVIIPVFNASKSLSRCLESILSQSFNDIEVICVDDGSTDLSLEILREYAHVDSRVKCFNQKNSGPSVARNKGLLEAKGEWILFVDADDYLCDNEALSVIYNAIVSNEDCELVRFSGKVNIQGDEYSDNLVPELYENGWQCLEEGCLQSRCIVPGSVFVQCYKKSVIDTYHTRFESSLWYAEDRLFVCTYYLQAKKTVVLSNVLYCYVVNEGSLMHDSNKRSRLDVDQRKAAMLLEKQLKGVKRNLPHLRKYIHGMYIRSIGELKRNEIDWRFLFRNASNMKMKLKDLLLFLDVNLY